MSRAKLIEKLRIPIGKRRRLSNPDGPSGRLMKLRQTVTALIKHERIELNDQLGDESRGYAERLISEAILYGDKHKPTMEMASFWLLEEQLVHKLFKVLVPRYASSKESYTNMWKAPNVYPGSHYQKCVVELRNNIYPELGPKIANQYLLHNMLLDEARKALQAKQKIDSSVSEKNEEADKTEKVDTLGEQNLSLKEEPQDDSTNNLKT